MLGYTEATRRQVTRLSSLVSDLLDVSRIAAGRFTVEREPVDLAAVVREVVARFEPQAHRAGSRLTLEAPESLETQSDRLRFDQVVTNLVDNAIKYGDGKPIHVRLAREPGWAVLTVSDEGIGIDPTKLDVIFGRYERAVSERHYGGLGLGLYISRSVVEATGRHRLGGERARRGRGLRGPAPGLRRGERPAVLQRAALAGTGLQRTVVTVQPRCASAPGTRRTRTHPRRRGGPPREIFHATPDPPPLLLFLPGARPRGRAAPPSPSPPRPRRPGRSTSRDATWWSG